MTAFFGTLITNITTIMAIATFLDLIITKETQKKIVSYLEPKRHSEQINHNRPSFADVFNSIVSAFLVTNSYRPRFLRSAQVTLLLFISMVAFTYSILWHQGTNMKFFVPDTFTLTKMIVPYITIFLIVIIMDYISFFQTITFMRLMHSTKSWSEFFMVVYADIVLSFTISLFISFFCIFFIITYTQSQFTNNARVRFTQGTSGNGLNFVSQQVMSTLNYKTKETAIVGDSPEANAMFEKEQSSSKYIEYIMSKRPSFTVNDFDCSEQRWDPDSVASQASTKVLSQICFDLHVAHIYGPDFDMKDATQAAFSLALMKGPEIIQVGLLSLYGFDPFSHAGTRASGKGWRESYLGDLISEASTSTASSWFARNYILSFAAFSSLGFTIMLYALGFALFCARVAGHYLVKITSFQFVSRNIPILSVSTYVIIAYIIIQTSLYVVRNPASP